MNQRTNLASWQRLCSHAQTMKQTHIRELFDCNENRFNEFSIELEHFLIDYSKNLLSKPVFADLIELAKDCQVEQWREKMFAGERINATEERAVLHTALRGSCDDEVRVDGEQVAPQVARTLKKIAEFSQAVRSGEWLGYSGKPITDVVNIGVGGSNLGPQMVTEALHHYSDKRVNIHYVSNVDGTQIANVLRPLNPETVLFIVSSKTFTTSETLTNANTAVRWLTAASFDDSAIAKHFVAVTANAPQAVKFGIDADCIFEMWDWVGGRFSLWSAIGLPIAIDLGMENFERLLEGARQMDEHFLDAELSVNAPVIMALLSLWNCTFLGAQSQAILPYDQAMHRLAAYLQQAEMESNGKSVNWDGKAIDYATVPSIWGELGINGQHAFYQYLHQSNNVVPADFIGSVESLTPIAQHHETLLANMLAQTQALMMGVDEAQVRSDLASKGRQPDYIEKVAPHKVHQGNRPTNTILLKRLEPQSLGALIALYEHKIFVQGILLQICSFDQWGVELGKGLANKIQQELANGDVNQQHDSSTLGLMAFYERVRTIEKCSP